MKNRVLRLALVVILVFSMVLTMVACGGDDVKPSPNPTQTPTATPTPDSSTDPSVDPSKKPTATGDEGVLESYGITFEAEDQTYDETQHEFGLTYDINNPYFISYFQPFIADTADTFDYVDVNVNVAVEDFEGNTDPEDKVKIGSTGTLGDTDVDVNNFSQASAQSIADLTVYATDAGIYTVTYTFVFTTEEEFGKMTVEQEEQELVITKTYTINKKEVTLESVSDAFLVADEATYPAATAFGEPELRTKLDKEYEDAKIVVDVVAVDETKVGEYPLNFKVVIDDEEFAIEDLVHQNYTFTTKVGTRYIVTEEDVAKANMVRKLVSIDLDDAKLYTTTYSVETINAYKALTEGQKVLSQTTESRDYLTDKKPVDAEEIEKSEFNLGRSSLVDDIKALAEEYAKNYVGVTLEEEGKGLVSALLALDNEAGDFDSDFAYVVSQLGTATGTPGEFKYEIITPQGTNKAHIFTATVVDGEVETATLYDATAATAPSTSDSLIENYLNKLIQDYDTQAKEVDDKQATATGAYVDFIKAPNQEKLNTLNTELEDVNESYGKLIDFQADALEAAHEELNAQVADMVARYEAYMDIIASYDFKAYTIDVNDSSVNATRTTLIQLLGYSFENQSLGMVTVNGTPVADQAEFSGLAALMFEKTPSDSDGIKNPVPTILLQEISDLYQSYIEVILELQELTATMKTSFRSAVIEGIGADAYSLFQKTAVGEFTASTTMGTDIADSAYYLAGTTSAFSAVPDVTGMDYYMNEIDLDIITEYADLADYVTGEEVLADDFAEYVEKAVEDMQKVAKTQYEAEIAAAFTVDALQSSGNTLTVTPAAYSDFRGNEFIVIVNDIEVEVDQTGTGTYTLTVVNNFVATDVIKVQLKGTDAIITVTNSIV